MLGLYVNIPLSLFFCRSISDDRKDWYEIACTITFDTEFLKNTVRYTYAVCPIKEGGESQEYLYGYKGNPSRCLKLNKKQLSKLMGGTFTHVVCHSTIEHHFISLSVMFKVCFTSTTQ